MKQTWRAVTALAVTAIVVACAGTGSTAPVAPPKATAGATIDSTPAVTPSATPRLTLPPPSAPATPAASDVLSRVESNRYPYSIEIPASWGSGEMGAIDVYGPESERYRQVDVQFHAMTGHDAAGWFAEAVKTLNNFAPIDVQRETTLDAIPGGPATWYEVHPSADGHELFIIRIVVVDGPDAWDLTWIAPAGTEEADRGAFTRLVDTFQRSDAPRNVWSLAVGDCFASLSLADASQAGRSAVFVGPVDQFQRLPCDDAHTGEVIAAFVASADIDCDAYFKPYVGRPLKGSSYAVLTFMALPSPTQAGDGAEVRCGVADASGPSVGSAKGSAR
jgi:hypothetical protein